MNIKKIKHDHIANESNRNTTYKNRLEGLSDKSKKPNSVVEVSLRPRDRDDWSDGIVYHRRKIASATAAANAPTACNKKTLEHVKPSLARPVSGFKGSNLTCGPVLTLEGKRLGHMDVNMAEAMNSLMVLHRASCVPIIQTTEEIRRKLMVPSAEKIFDEAMNLAKVFSTVGPVATKVRGRKTRRCVVARLLVRRCYDQKAPICKS